MAQEIFNTETVEFFDHPAEEVAPKVAENWFVADQEPKETYPGQPSFVQVSTQSETIQLKVLLIEAFSARIPGRIWKGKRLQELQALPPGSIKAYGSRAGVIPFIVAKDGDNLAIRGAEIVSTGEKLKNASAVAKALDLKHGDEGRLFIQDPTHFIFEK